MKDIPIILFIAVFFIQLNVFCYVNVAFKKGGIKLLWFRVRDLPGFNMNVAALNIVLLFVFKILVLVIYHHK